jgi:hypothetical protein
VAQSGASSAVTLTVERIVAGADPKKQEISFPRPNEAQGFSRGDRYLVLLERQKNGEYVLPSPSTGYFKYVGGANQSAVADFQVPQGYFWASFAPGPLRADRLEEFFSIAFARTHDNGRPKTPDWVIQSLRTLSPTQLDEQSTALVTLALEVLHYIGESSQRDFVLPFLKNENPYTRFETCRALETIGGKQSVDAILQLIRDGKTTALDQVAALEAIAGKLDSEQKKELSAVRDQLSNTEFKLGMNARIMDPRVFQLGVPRAMADNILSR